MLGMLNARSHPSYDVVQCFFVSFAHFDCYGSGMNHNKLGLPEYCAQAF